MLFLIDATSCRAESVWVTFTLDLHPVIARLTCSRD